MCTTLSIVKVFGIDHNCEVLIVILKIKSGLLLITATGDKGYRRLIEHDLSSISRCSNNLTQAGDFQLKYHPPLKRTQKEL